MSRKASKSTNKNAGSPSEYLWVRTTQKSTLKKASDMKGKHIFGQILAKIDWNEFEFWTKGFFINTVGQKGNEDSIQSYVRNRGREKEYEQLHRVQQLSVFAGEFDTP